MAVVGKSTVRVAGPRGSSFIRAGTVYEDNDPLVKSRPDLFESPEGYQRRKARPRSTADLGRRSMSGRRLLDGTETARQAPGGTQTRQASGEKAHACPAADTTGCDKRFGSARGAKAHAKKTHGGKPEQEPQA